MCKCCSATLAILHVPWCRQQKVEVTIRTARFGVIRAEETRDDLYAAIDVASDKIHRSLRRLKEKAVAKGNWPGRGGSKGAQSMANAALSAADSADDEADDEADDFPSSLVPSVDEVKVVTRNLDIPASVKKTKVFYLDAMKLQVCSKTCMCFNAGAPSTRGTAESMCAT
jgi:ribosome-associated translation inhibitor RaiA